MKQIPIIFFLFFTIPLFAQQTKIDSLHREVNKAKGSNRILQLNELAHAYWDGDLKKSITNGNEALRLAEQLKFYKAKARSYNIISWAYFLMNDFTSADKYCDSSLIVSKAYGTDPDRMKSLRNKTSFYAQGYVNKNFSIKSCLDELLELSRKKGDYERFEDATINIIVYNAVCRSKFNMIGYLESLERKADKNLKPTLYLLYGYYYESNKQHFKSIEMLKKALIYKNNHIRFQCLITLGAIYNDLNRFKESNKYFLEALSNNLDSGDLLTLYFNLAAVNIGLQDYKQAYKYAIGCNRYYGNGFKLYKESEWLMYNNLGRIYLGLDSLEKATYCINRALSLSDSLSSKSYKLTSLQTKYKLIKKQNGNKNLSETVQSIAQIIDSVHDNQIKNEGYKQLTDYYKSTSDYQKSLYYLEKWRMVNDSLNSKESMQVFNEFQTQYETEKKEEQIALQKDEIRNKNRLMIIELVSGVLILMALILIWFLYKKRNEAYKRLVLQSLNCPNDILKPLPEIVLDENSQYSDGDKCEIRTTQLSDLQKKHLIEKLNRQIELKMHLQPDITINQLAKLCKTNRTYLSQLINEYYNVNFSTFINNLRIEEAKQILANPKEDVQLKTLYPILGFNSYTVFHDAFRKYIGVTPACFRQTIKDLEE
jgi:AraC-like DNA-binding protein